MDEALVRRGNARQPDTKASNFVRREAASPPRIDPE